MRARRPVARRPGMTLVESAVTLSVFLVLLFGVFEYCRFLLVLHVAHNAARDGARYAGVNGDKPPTFAAADYTDPAGRVYPSVVGYVTARMGGVDRQLDGFQVAVYPVDPAGLAQTPPVVRSDTRSTASPRAYPDPFAPDANSPDWNAAVFPNRVAVTVRGTYTPLTPVLLLMPASIPVSVTATAGAGG